MKEQFVSNKELTGFCDVASLGAVHIEHLSKGCHVWGNYYGENTGVFDFGLFKEKEAKELVAKILAIKKELA